MARRNSLLVRRAYYQMGLVTLFSSLLWVSVSVYLALTSPADVGVEASLLTTVSPKIDEATTASIAGRTQISAMAVELAREANASFAAEERETETETSTASASEL